MPPRPSAAAHPAKGGAADGEGAGGSMGSTVVSVLTALLSIPALAGA